MTDMAIDNPLPPSDDAPHAALSCDTGRIRRPLPREIRRVVFGLDVEAARGTDLPWIARIEQAHLLMLLRCGLIDPPAAHALLKVIVDIAARRFEDFRGREPVRGTYLLWERRLCELTGDDLGGRIHLARSRNDINATLLRLKLRRPVGALCIEGARLMGELLCQAQRWADCLSVGYTHFQAAVPLTWGHQLLGWAAAVGRDLRGLLDAAIDLRRCPMGAGALGGTSLPIDPTYVAELLGFDMPALNSLDAVAARDFALRLTSAAAVFAVTLSRIATDLLIFSTAEFGFLELPDELVGSSSQMPQKRNPFLLEHVQSRGMSAAGAFVTEVASMHATPFSNSVAAGTEAVRPAAAALSDVRDSAYLLRQVLGGLQPRPATMAGAADARFVTAVALADRIVLEGGLPFRTAHHLVGQIVSDALSAGTPLLKAAARRLFREGLMVDLAGLDAASVVRAAEYGGGPGANSMRRQIESLRGEHRRLRNQLRLTRQRERHASELLSRHVRNVLDGDPTASLNPNGPAGIRGEHL